MGRSLRVKFLLMLVAVVVTGLGASLVLRELMVRDFREYLEGEMEDRAYWLAAALESSYASSGGWSAEKVWENAIWAVLLGLDVRIVDGEGALILDTESAIQSLPPLIKERVLAAAEEREPAAGHEWEEFPLRMEGRGIGRLEVRMMPPRKQVLYVERSNEFLLVSVLALGGAALVLSVVFSRMMARPVRKLTEAAGRISEGDLTSRVPIESRDEIGRLSASFNRMAEALLLQDALKKRVTSNIAHELRTPIAAVRGELEGMVDGLIPATPENLRSLHAEMGRLRTILEGIEALDQAEASSLSLERRPVELAPFLRTMVERHARVFAEKGVELTLDADAAPTVQADPDRLSQVVINLLSNALKATDAGGQVRVSAGREGPDVVLSVADTGRGIPADEQPLVFERFHHGTTGGLGIGLTIVRELVEAHGGSVALQSRPGHGATFTVRLPA